MHLELGVCEILSLPLIRHPSDISALKLQCCVVLSEDKVFPDVLKFTDIQVVSFLT